MNIFESEQKKVMEPSAEWRGVDLCPDDVRPPLNGRLPGMCKIDNHVRHVERPRKGYDYSY